MELASKGAHVIVASRNASKGQEAVEEIKAATGNELVEYLQLDLLSLASVTKFIEEFKAKNLPIHVLLNNAGIMANPFTLSEDGIESQFATNHASRLFHCDFAVVFYSSLHIKNYYRSAISILPRSSSLSLKKALPAVSLMLVPTDTAFFFAMG
jgi:NAD(P)-dependent dehydrogenase (short-subunit alcohol dehydrogenase family)